MRKGSFVLGFERQRTQLPEIAGFSQSWLCHIAPPFDALLLRVLETKKEGGSVPGGQLSDRMNKGISAEVQVNFELVPELMPQLMVAKLKSKSLILSDKRLLDFN